jgi:hypothetical protein
MIEAAVAAHRVGRRRSPLLVLTSALLVVLAAPVRAGEPMYVIEQLVVAVNSAPAGAGDRVATIKSGDRVEILDRQGDEAQIQLANGTSGWVKASYLSRELPLQRRLEERAAEVEKLTQEVARLQSRGRSGSSAPASPRTMPHASSTAGSALDQGSTAMPSAPSRPQDWAAPPSAPAITRGSSERRDDSAAHSFGSAGSEKIASREGLATQPDGASPSATVRDPSPFMGARDPASQPLWLWVVACSSGALVVAFVAGWRTLDRRIRRKYGGMRIY